MLRETNEHVRACGLPGGKMEYFGLAKKRQRLDYEQWGVGVHGG